MKELVYTIVKNLVDDPSQIQVNEIEGQNTDVIEIVVPKKDLGKIIGKKGNTADSIRSIIYAASFKTKKRYTIDITSDEDLAKKNK